MEQKKKYREGKQQKKYTKLYGTVNYFAFNLGKAERKSV